MLSDLVDPALVAHGVQAASKKGAFQALAAFAAPRLGVEHDAVVAALAARERLGTTGFGGGVAIPHGRLEGMPRIAGAVIRLAAPVDWAALDGEPVDLVFMLLGPEAAGAAHLKALAKVSRLVRDRAFVAKLRGARDGEAMRALVGDGVAALAA